MFHGMIQIISIQKFCLRYIFRDSGRSIKTSLGVEWVTFGLPLVSDSDGATRLDLNNILNKDRFCSIGLNCMVLNMKKTSTIKSAVDKIVSTVVSKPAPWKDVVKGTKNISRMYNTNKMYINILDIFMMQKLTDHEKFPSHDEGASRMKTFNSRTIEPLLPIPCRLTLKYKLLHKCPFDSLFQ